jgi:hypothetical protein
MYCYMTLLVTLVPSPSWQNYEANRKANLLSCLAAFTEAITWTQECTPDERA